MGFTYYGASVGLSFGFGLHHDAWTFVPANHFNDHEVWRHRVGGGERAALYQHSKVINNYTYNDNRIINRGVPSERLPALKRAEVRQVAIRDMPEGRGGAIRPDRLQQNGAQTVVYRPKLPAEVQHSMKAAENHATPGPSRRSLPRWVRRRFDRGRNRDLRRIPATCWPELGSSPIHWKKLGLLRLGRVLARGASIGLIHGTGSGSFRSGSEPLDPESPAGDAASGSAAQSGHTEKPADPRSRRPPSAIRRGR